MPRLILILLLLAAAVGVYFYTTSPKHPDISKVSFTLLDGRQFETTQLQGKPLLVTFWATTCASCIKEIPDLIKLYNKYSPRGLEIIAVAMPYDRPDHVLEMVKTRKLPYPVALDIEAKIVRAFGNIRVTPNNFLITPNGKIIKHQIGILDIADTEQLLQSMQDQ